MMQQLIITARATLEDARLVLGKVLIGQNDDRQWSVRLQHLCQTVFTHGMIYDRFDVHGSPWRQFIFKGALVSDPFVGQITFGADVIVLKVEVVRVVIEEDLTRSPVCIAAHGRPTHQSSPWRRCHS